MYKPLSFSSIRPIYLKPVAPQAVQLALKRSGTQAKTQGIKPNGDIPKPPLSAKRNSPTPTEPVTQRSDTAVNKWPRDLVDRPFPWANLSKTEDGTQRGRTVKPARDLISVSKAMDRLSSALEYAKTSIDSHSHKNSEMTGVLEAAVDEMNQARKRFEALQALHAYRHFPWQPNDLYISGSSVSDGTLPEPMDLDSPFLQAVNTPMAPQTNQAVIPSDLLEPLPSLVATGTTGTSEEVPPDFSAANRNGPIDQWEVVFARLRAIMKGGADYQPTMPAY